MRTSKTNLSVIDNTGTRVQPRIVVGEGGDYKSGDILDANAVMQEIKESGGGDIDSLKEQVDSLQETVDALLLIITPEIKPTKYYYLTSTGLGQQYLLKDVAYSDVIDDLENGYVVYGIYDLYDVNSIAPIILLGRYGNKVLFVMSSDGSYEIVQKQ